MLRIFIKGDTSFELRKTLKELQAEHVEKVEGIYELYQSMMMKNSCASYSKARIYYVAYTLTTANIEFVLC